MENSTLRKLQSNSKYLQDRFKYFYGHFPKEMRLTSKPKKGDKVCHTRFIGVKGYPIAVFEWTDSDNEHINLGNGECYVKFIG